MLEHSLLLAFTFSESPPTLDRAPREQAKELVVFLSAMSLTNIIQCKLILTLLLPLENGKRLQALERRNGGLLVPSSSKPFSRAAWVGAERRSARWVRSTVLSSQLIDRETPYSSGDVHLRIGSGIRRLDNALFSLLAISVRPSLRQMRVLSSCATVALWCTPPNGTYVLVTEGVVGS